MGMTAKIAAAEDGMELTIVRDNGATIDVRVTLHGCVGSECVHSVVNRKCRGESRQDTEGVGLWRHETSLVSIRYRTTAANGSDECD